MTSSRNRTAMPADTPKPSGKPPALTREERLAAALRENLRRRKDQERGRHPGSAERNSEAPEPDEPSGP